MYFFLLWCKEWTRASHILFNSECYLQSLFLIFWGTCIVLYKHHWFIFLLSIQKLLFLQILVKTHYCIVMMTMKCNVIFDCVIISISFWFIIIIVIYYLLWTPLIQMYASVCVLDYSYPWIILKSDYLAFELNEILRYFGYNSYKIRGFQVFHPIL